MKPKVTLIKDRTDFTDEQRRMIEQIGEKHKNRRNYYLNRFYIKSLLFLCAYILVLLFLYSLDSNDSRVSFALPCMLLISSTIGFFAGKKKIVKDLSGDLYDIGLLYVDVDEEVIDNNDKVFTKISKNLLGAGLFCLVLAVMGFMWFRQVNDINYSDLMEVSGILVSIDMNYDNDLEMKIENDDFVYIIDSKYTNLMNISKLFDEIELGDLVVFRHAEPFEGSNDWFKEVFHFESNDIVYLDIDMVEEGIQRSSTGAITFIVISIIVSIGSFVTYFVYKYKILDNRISMEKYDLSARSDQIIDFEA